MKSNNTLYLLTGAVGFLGSHICAELIGRGDRVRALALPGDKSVKYLPKSVELCEGDLCNEASVRRFFDVPAGSETVVIHCASMVTTLPDYDPRLTRVNVDGTKNMIAVALAHPKCKKFVYVSLTGAIPELPKGEAIREVDHFDPEQVVGCYSQSKALATQAVLDAVHERGLNACVVFPSGIISPGDYAKGEVTRTLMKIVNGEMAVGMGGSFNLCDVRDLAHGCIGAADMGRKGECYILGNKEVTLKEMCRILHAETNCATPKFYIPVGLAELLSKQMERRAAKTGERPVLRTYLSNRQ